jgi:hypothetical protein
MDRTEMSMPHTRSFLQTIKGLDQVTVIIRLIRINETRRLLHIYLLIKKTIEKGILNVKMAKMPLARGRQR